MRTSLGTTRSARVPALVLVGVAAATVAASALPAAAASNPRPRAQSHEVAGTPGFVSDAHRLFDSRANTAGPSGPTSGFIPVTTTDDVPQGAVVTLSIQAVGATGSGYVTAYPDGNDQPGTSALDYTTGQTISAPVLISVPSNGVVDVDVVGAKTNLIVDQVGYYNSGDFVAPTPVRVADSRSGLGVAKGAKTGTVTVPLGDDAPANGVVALTVTTTASSGNGYVAIGGSKPPTSVIDFQAGPSFANLVYAKAVNGDVTFTVSGAATQLVVDLDGYAPSGSVVTVPTAQRVGDTRTHQGFSTGPVVGAQTLTLPASLVPTGTTAVLLNVTAFAASYPGYTLGYSGTTRPGISELQYPAGQTSRANLITVPVTNNTVTLYFQASTQAVVDFEGAVGTVTTSTN